MYIYIYGIHDISDHPPKIYLSHVVMVFTIKKCMYIIYVVLTCNPGSEWEKSSSRFK